jgi:alpha-tubulin suppressor-like RCC1 family protein
MRRVIVVFAVCAVLVAACGGSSDKKDEAAARNAAEGVPQLNSGAPLLTTIAWGNNDYGQVGIGSVCNPHGQPECYAMNPTNVRGQGLSSQLTQVRSLVTGGFHTLALRSDRTVVAWGSNQRGQIGDGSHSDAVAAPVVVKGVGGKGNLTGVRSLAGGGAQSMAITQGGRAWAWGDNNFGQLGIGTSTGPAQCVPVQEPVATAAPPLESVPTGAAGDGYNRACAETPTAVLSPEGTGQFRGVAAVSGGDTHTVALLDDGTVWAWGNNDYGQLGIGNHDGPEECKPYSKYAAVGCSTKPVQVSGPGGNGHLTDVKAIAAGADFTLALRGDGTVWAWGSNAWTTLGQTDPGLLEQCATPWAPVPQYCSTKPLQVVSSDGSGALTDVIAVSAESFGLHAAALKSDGTVWTWGVNATGELGNGVSEQYSDAPVPVVSPDDSGLLTDIVDVRVSGKSTLALRKDGTVWAWGYNGWAQLGIGDNTGPQTCTTEKVPCALTPQQVHGVNGKGVLTNVATIAAGATHVVAATTRK